MKRVWEGEGFPEEWKEGLIKPICKKVDIKRIENYRGITLLNSAYEVYAMILTERLRKEIEDKELLPESQAGFRIGIGVLSITYTIHILYILQHVVVKEGKQKIGKVCAFFIYLKTAFPSVNREKL